MDFVRTWLSRLTPIKLSNYKIPTLIRAESAISLIKDQELVTISPAKGIVFRGEIISDQAIIEAVCHKNQGGFFS